MHPQSVIVSVVGIVALAMGFVIPGMVDDVFQEAVEDNTFLTPGSEALENLLEPAKRGLAGVRVTEVSDLDLDADEYEDGGVRYVMRISNITNPEAALYDGARPQQSDVAYAFRKYTRYQNTSFSNDDASITWDSQSEYIYVDDPARLDTEVLTIPNVGFAGFEALIPTLVGAARGVDALQTQAVSLRGADAIAVDDIAIPIFVAQFMASGSGSLVAVLKASVLPVVIPTRLQIARQAANMGDTALEVVAQATAQVGGAVPANYTVDPVLVLTPPTPTSTNVGATVYADLMNPSSTSGVALVSSAGLPKWIGIATLFAAVDPTDLAAVLAVVGSTPFQTFTQEFATAYGYTDAAVAADHVLQVALMMGGLMGPDSTAAGLATLTTFSQFVQLQGEATVSLPAVSDIGLLAAQMGSSTVTGVLANAGGALPAGITLAMAAGSGDGDANVCLNGAASLFTSIGDPNSLNSYPEFSCVANAAPTIYAQRTHHAQAGRVFAGSKLGGDIAMALIGQFSQSPALFNEAGALLGDALPDFGAGSEAIWRFRAVYLKNIATRTDIMAVINAQVTAHSAYLEATATGGDVATALGAKLLAYGTSLGTDAALHAECAQMIQDDVASGIPDMDCFQVHDVFLWLEHASNALVFFPNLVETYYGPENTPATTPGRSSNNMGTGPYIKATARMLLLDGFRESILTSLGFGIVPPLVSNATEGTTETLGTGGGSRDSFWQIQSVEGQTEVQDWSGTVADPTPIEGSYDGLRHPYGEEGLDTEASDLPLRIKVWVSQAERFVWLYKAVDLETMEQMDTVDGPHGKLEGLQRYTIHPEEITLEAYGDDGGPPFSRYENDILFNSPEGCMISIRAHPEYVTAQTLASATGNEADSTTSFDLFLTQPSNLACNATVRAQSSDYAQEPTQAVHGSFIDVDPISGRAVNAARKLAGVIRLRPFGMYPRLAENTGGEHVYMQIQWIEEGGQATPDTEQALKDVYESTRTTRFALFVGLVAGGALLLLVGVAIGVFCGGCCTNAAVQAGGEGSTKGQAAGAPAESV